MVIKLVNDGVNTISSDKGLQDVREFLNAKRISLENTSLPSVLTEKEKDALSLVNSHTDKIHQELLRIIHPGTQLSTEHLELLNCMIYEAASESTSSKSPILYREVAQIANFIKIHAKDSSFS